jgi:alkylation response protein AidB-like acyl-CoA dehydrogenase
METTRAERQQKFIQIAATHAEDFKTRVTQHDRENTFAFENVAAMKASGYTNMTAPEELGGGGADILDLVLAQERLGRGDLPTAITINMHLFAVGWVADLWRLDKRKNALSALLESVIRDRLILSGGVSDPKINSAVGFGGLIDTSRRAERVDGGYIVNGVAKFGTLSACADLLFETAHYDDPVKGPQVLGFYLPAKTKGIKIQNNWDTLSIRSSASNDIVWENVFVPEEIVSARPARAPGTCLTTSFRAGCRRSTRVTWDWPRLRETARSTGRAIACRCRSIARPAITREISSSRPRWR